MRQILENRKPALLINNDLCTLWCPESLKYFDDFPGASNELFTPTANRPYFSRLGILIFMHICLAIHPITVAFHALSL
jgi:hypothetical protein